MALYRVRKIKNSVYQVYLDAEEDGWNHDLFQGSIADCYAWIQLRRQDILD
jgi:hypothetical protein